MSRRQILLLSFFLVLVLAVADYFTGAEISFSFFYLFPIAIVTWYINIQAGNLMIFISIAAWLISNALAGDTYTNEWIRYWNAALRLAFFLFVNILLDNLKSALEKVTRLARTDYMTGMINNREFYRLAELEILRSRRYGLSFAMLFIDVDNFKQVNDTHGHLAGDDVLKAIAREILGCLRRTDLAARVGGDEFAILLPEGDRAAAEAVVQKIHTGLNHLTLLVNHQITISIGCVVFHQPPDTLNEVIQQADELMYEVKRQGKNDIQIIER